MKRWEANIYMKCIAILAFGIIAAVFLMTLPVDAAQMSNFGAYGDGTVEDEYFIDQTDETSKKGQIREDSGMPCINREQFERWYANYEQETGEEVTSERTESTERIDAECIPVQQTEEVQMETTTKTYAVGESILNPDLQSYLYQRLADHHIEWFMPYAIMMAYQESHFDCTAVNQSNLRDMGLFQFRINYYPGQDIFNPYEQIDIFVQQMANRASAGRTVSEMISAHNVSDYGGYNQAYVDQVLSHANNLREVK